MMLLLDSLLAGLLLSLMSGPLGVSLKVCIAPHGNQHDQGMAL